MTRLLNVSAYAMVVVALIFLIVYAAIDKPWWVPYVAAPLVSILAALSVPASRRHEPRYLIGLGVMAGISLWSVMMLVTGMARP